MVRAGLVQIMALCALLAGCAGGDGPTLPVTPQALQSLDKVHVDRELAVSLLNRYRASRGLSPLRLDPALTALAQKQADAMAARNTLSHDAGGAFASRVAATGLDPVWAGENVGGGYYSTQEAFDGWRASSQHNANMLEARATRFGIALAKNPATQYRAYWALALSGEPAAPAAGGPFAMGEPLVPVRR